MLISTAKIRGWLHTLGKRESKPKTSSIASRGPMLTYIIYGRSSRRTTGIWMKKLGTSTRCVTASGLRVDGVAMITRASARFRDASMASARRHAATTPSTRFRDASMASARRHATATPSMRRRHRRDTHTHTHLATNAGRRDGPVVHGLRALDLPGPDC